MSNYEISHRNSVTASTTVFLTLQPECHMHVNSTETSLGDDDDNLACTTFTLTDKFVTGART